MAVEFIGSLVNGSLRATPGSSGRGASGLAADYAQIIRLVQDRTNVKADEASLPA